jgi:hypothetical protein
LHLYFYLKMFFINLRKFLSIFTLLKVHYEQERTLSNTISALLMRSIWFYSWFCSWAGLYWYLNIELALCNWNTFYLVMVNNSFLYIIESYFLIFCWEFLHLHSWYWSIVFLVISLSVFGIWILFWPHELGSIPSASIFCKRV